MNNLDEGIKEGIPWVMKGIGFRREDGSPKEAGGMAEEMDTASRVVGLVVKVCKTAFQIAHIF